MEQFTIYYGTPEGKRTKIGVDSKYPNRINQQKISDGQVLEVHTCVYEVSKREMELQREYGVKVDTVPYYVTYFNSQKPKRCAKISEANKGRERSEEAKAKIGASNSISQLGNTNAAGNKGKTLTEETKSKISAARMGIEVSAETKAKISAAKKGVPKPKAACPHCNILMSSIHISRHIKAKHKEHA